MKNTYKNIVLLIFGIILIFVISFGRYTQVQKKFNVNNAFVWLDENKEDGTDKKQCKGKLKDYIMDYSEKHIKVICGLSEYGAEKGNNIVVISETHLCLRRETLIRIKDDKFDDYCLLFEENPDVEIEVVYRYKLFII